MRGQSADADCRRAPGRHLGFTDVTLGGPFATARTRPTSQVIGRWSCIPTVQVVGSLSALSGMELLVANAPRLLDFSFQRFSFFPLASQSGHLHEASLALTRPRSPTGFASRQVTVLFRWTMVAPSALFRPHRWPDSSAFRPLHSLPHSASPTSLDALAHSDGRKLPRPALTAVRPKMTDNGGRDAPHIGTGTK